MKVAIIGQKGIPATWGGVEVHVDNLSRQLGSLGYEVVVYARKHYVTKAAAQDFMKQHSNVRIVFVPSIHTKHLDTISHTFFATVHALFQRVDVFHYQSVGPSLLAWIPRLLRPRAQVVSTFHSPDRLHQKWGVFARTMLTLGEQASIRFANKTITVSRDLQRYVLNEYNAQAIYIPNGVNTVQYRRPSMITAEWGLQEQGYVLMVSRLVRHKGAHYLVKAFQGVETDKKLVIVGDSAQTDDYVAELKALAEGDDRIIFTGYQSGQILEELFSNAYLYVQPSESEGLSVAVLEAGSYGLGVLTSDIPSNVELVQNKGFLFENRNVDNLREQLAVCLSSETAVEEAGRLLRSHVNANYHWSSVAQATQEVYEKQSPTVFAESAAVSARMQ